MAMNVTKTKVFQDLKIPNQCISIESKAVWFHQLVHKIVERVFNPPNIEDIRTANEAYSQAADIDDVFPYCFCGEGT